MPKPIKFIYEKKTPFRDAFFFIIMCEGKNREPDYFNFFVGISSRVKIVPVESTTGSAPKLLIDNAISTEEKLGAKPDIDRVWFVIDTDRWRNQLHDIRVFCSERSNWFVAQSNPCFEVWLYFHAKATLPPLENLGQCNAWKAHLPAAIQGGFNSDFHPIAIETAIINSKAAYHTTGYFPDPGSTDLWQLGEALLPLIIKEMNMIKNKFPAPVVRG